MSWQGSKEDQCGEVYVASVPVVASQSESGPSRRDHQKEALSSSCGDRPWYVHDIWWMPLSVEMLTPLVLKLAQEFKCSVCQERNKVSSRQVATLEALPPKFHTIAADIGHWTHVRTGEQQNFMVIMDEGSHYRVAKILSKGE